MPRTRLVGGLVAGAMGIALLSAPAAAAERPLTKADCRDGRWAALGYRNQGDCVSASNHGATVDEPDGTGIDPQHNETVLTVG